MNAQSERDLSASGSERRAEDKRRNERKSDVVIGKTSAIQGEKDFKLDPKATETSFMDSSTAVEQEIFQQTSRGLDMLRALELEDADQAFNRVLELNPSAYVWQAGITKYYLGNVEDAGNILARSARQSETRFGMPASEERIWRDACELKYMVENPSFKSSGANIEEIIASPEDPDPMDGTSIRETRKVFRIARDLFRASAQGDMTGVLLGRAKLRAISGKFGEKPRVDQKMWRLNAWYYLGLHYDSVGEEDDSKECMEMALRLCPTSGFDSVPDISYTLPKLHLKARSWIGEVDPELLDGRKPEEDPLVKSINENILKMDLNQLRDALETTDLPGDGSKGDLQERLFNALIEEMGLDLTP